MVSGERPRKAVFVDRDGVLLVTHVRNGRPFAITRPEEYALLPGVVDGVEAMKGAGYVVVVVTNQPDLANGKIDVSTLGVINDRLQAETGVDSIEVCPHAEADGCACRKPAPGLLLEVGRKLNIDLGESFMIGDRWRDIDAGVAAGCRTIFIDRFYDEPLKHDPDEIAVDFFSAVEIILRSAPGRSKISDSAIIEG